MADSISFVNPTLYPPYFNSSTDVVYMETAVLAGSRLKMSSVPVADGMTVYLDATTIGALPRPLAKSTLYYVRDAGLDSLRLARTAGGTAIEFIDSGRDTPYVGVSGPFSNPLHDPDVVDWVAFAKANIAEARKFGKPVLAWISPSLVGAGEVALPGEFFEIQLRTLYPIVDGIVIWELATQPPQFYEGQGWWQVLQRFAREVTPPSTSFLVELN